MPADFVPHLFELALVAPLIAFVLAIVLRGGGNVIVQALLIAGGLSGIAGVIEVAMSGFPPVAIFPSAHAGFMVTGLSGFFLGLIYIGVILTSLFACYYVPHYQNSYAPRWLNAATALFIFGMEATVLSGIVIGFLISWEIMSLSAYFLVIADRGETSLKAGLLYLVMTHIGFACLMAGFMLLSDGNPWATWFDLAQAAKLLNPPTLAAAFLLLFAGFGSKAGLVPLHQWLPYAHPQAPSHSSGLLSGVMLKVALFGFIQSLSLFPGMPLWYAITIMAVGLASALFGVAHAAIESDMKRLLAWSSIENMGLIFSGVGAALALATLPASPALAALVAGIALFVTLHSFNHMLFKSGLFMSVGAMTAFTHTRDLDELGGLAQAWPFFSAVVLALVLSAAALPPFGSFFGEWIYVQSLAASLTSMPLSLAVCFAIALGCVGLVAGLAVFAFVNLFSSAFLGRARHAYHHVSLGAALPKMPRLMLLPPLLAALLLITASPALFMFMKGGVFVSVPRALVDVSVASGASMNAWFLLWLALALAAFGFLIDALMRTAVRVTDTWDCGAPLTPRMQYTSTGFASPIRFFFRALMATEKSVVAEPIAPGNPWIARRRLEWTVGSVWEERVYRPLSNGIMYVASLITWLQSGLIQEYLILLVIALVITMAFAL